MSLTIAQTRALVWKCWILRVRHKCLTFVECVFPLLMLIAFALVVAQFTLPQNHAQSQYGKRMPSPNFTNPRFTLSHQVIPMAFMDNFLLYMPKSTCTARLMERLRMVSYLRTGTPVSNMKIISEPDEPTLLDHFYKHFRSQKTLTSAVKILGNCESNNWHDFIFGQLQFQLYTHESIKEQAFPKKNYAGPFDQKLYKQFSLLLIMLNDARLLSALELQLSSNLHAHMLPHTKGIKNLNEQMVWDSLVNNFTSQYDKQALLEAYKAFSQNMSQTSNASIDKWAEVFSHESLDVQNWNESQIIVSVNDYLLKHVRKHANNVFANQLDLARSRPTADHSRNKSRTHPALPSAQMFPKWIPIPFPLPLYDIEVNQFVYPSYIVRPPPLITDTFPYIIIFGFIVSLPLLIKSITEEKDRGLRELFRLMGLTQTAYVLSIVIGYLPILLFHSFALSLLIRASFLTGSAVFPHCSFSLLVAIFICYSITSILFTLCLSVPFNKPILALIFSALAHIITTLPDYLLEPALVGNSTLVCFFRIISCLMPNMALNYSLRLISAKELYSQSQDWWSMFDMDHHYQGLSVGIIMAVQLWSCIFYLFLYWYLDNVWPWQDGVPKSMWFVFSAKFWRQSNAFNVPKDGNQSLVLPPLKDQNEHFEGQPAAHSYAFQLRNVRKVYGAGSNRNTAINNINLDLPEGELCVLLGHNGAGKSTLMKLITGMAVPTNGLMLINGHDMQTSTFKARTSISFCPQHNALYDELSALEHMWLFGALRSATVQTSVGDGKRTDKAANLFGSEEHMKLLMQLNLGDKADLPACTYSGGQKRKLCLAIALLGNPRLVILDEPTSGMDPEARRSVVEVLLRHRRRRAIFLTTHFLEEADAVADRICIMSSGQVKCFGSPTFLRAKFGAGYKLRIAKTLQFQPHHRIQLIHLLKHHFPSGEIIQESVGELIFALDPNSSTQSPDPPDPKYTPVHQLSPVSPASSPPVSRTDKCGQMARFFAQFENCRQELQISSCGLSVTTLEDVFLKVVTMDGGMSDSIEADDSISSITEISENEFRSDSIDRSDVSSWSLVVQSYDCVKLTPTRAMANQLVSCNPMLDPYANSWPKPLSSPLSNPSTDYQPESFVLLNGWSLHLNRIKALMIKRINYSKRHFSMFAFQLILPLVIFLLLFTLDSFLRKKMTENKRFELNSGQLYGSTEGFVQFSPQAKQKLNWEKLQNSFNLTFASERVRMHILDSKQNPQDYQRELTLKLPIDQYISRHLYGFSIYMANEPRIPMYQDKKKHKWYKPQNSLQFRPTVDKHPDRHHVQTSTTPMMNLAEQLPMTDNGQVHSSTVSLKPIVDQLQTINLTKIWTTVSANSNTIDPKPLSIDDTVSPASFTEAPPPQTDASEPVLISRLDDLLHLDQDQWKQLLLQTHKNNISFLDHSYNVSLDMNMFVQIWYNNEALHALPLAIQMMYQTLFHFYNVTSGGDMLPVHSWNRPMRTQFEYWFVLQFMHLFKIIWGIFGSIAFSFLSASYVLLPSAERSNQSKLLQVMTGTSLWLYWLAHCLFDLIIHLVLSVSLVALFYVFDSLHVFTGHPQSIASIFVLFMLFGLCMMPICYCISLYVRSASTAFSATLAFNLVGGIFLTLVDYILEMLEHRHILSASSLQLIFTLFRLFPLFSLTKAISKLYQLGSNSNGCSTLTPSFLAANCAPSMPFVGCCKDYCEDNCYEYQSPFSASKHTIIPEVTMLLANTLVWFLILFLLETGKLSDLITLIQTGFHRKWNRRNAASCSQDVHYPSAIETMRSQVRQAHSGLLDDDVLAEQKMVNCLIRSTCSSSSTATDTASASATATATHTAMTTSATTTNVDNHKPYPECHEYFRYKRSDFALLVHELSKHFDHKTVVDSLSFSVRNQECFGLLGINGAGKTTTFRMLVGDLKPTSGDAQVGNTSLVASVSAFSSHIGYCPQFDALLDNLTASETLQLFARLRGVPDPHVSAHVSRLIRLCDLSKHAHRVSRTFSGGTKRKLSVAIALTGRPQVLLLDEPTCGVDPKARRRIWKTLANARKVQQCSLLLTSHSMDECEALCARIGIMTGGQLRCLGSIQHLRAKFGHGYSLCIKLRPCYLHDEGYLVTLQSTICQALPSAVIKDVHQTVLDYHIGDTTIGWANLFLILDDLKHRFNLENYFVGDTTLEEIFIGFAKQQQAQKTGS